MRETGKEPQSEKKSGGEGDRHKKRKETGIGTWTSGETDRKKKRQEDRQAKNQKLRERQVEKERDKM